MSSATTTTRTTYEGMKAGHDYRPDAIALMDRIESDREWAIFCNDLFERSAEMGDNVPCLCDRARVLKWARKSQKHAYTVAVACSSAGLQHYYETGGAAQE